MLDAHHLGGFIVTVVTAPFLVIVGVLVISMVRSMARAGASRRWPAVNGVIASSAVSSHRSLDSTGMHTTIYEPVVVFAFTVAGRDEQSSNVSFSAVAGTSSSSDAEAVVARYTPGAAVQVFYNPTDPSEAVLEHATGGMNVAMLTVLGGLELLLVVLLVLGLTSHFD